MPLWLRKCWHHWKHTCKEIPPQTVAQAYIQYHIVSLYLLGEHKTCSNACTCSLVLVFGSKFHTCWKNCPFCPWSCCSWACPCSWRACPWLNGITSCCPWSWPWTCWSCPWSWPCSWPWSWPWSCPCSWPWSWPWRSWFCASWMNGSCCWSETEHKI